MDSACLAADPVSDSTRLAAGSESAWLAADAPGDPAGDGDVAADAAANGAADAAPAVDAPAGPAGDGDVPADVATAADAATAVL